MMSSLPAARLPPDPHCRRGLGLFWEGCVGVSISCSVTFRQKRRFEIYIGYRRFSRSWHNPIKVGSKWAATDLWIQSYLSLINTITNYIPWWQQTPVLSGVAPNERSSATKRYKEENESGNGNPSASGCFLPTKQVMEGESAEEEVQAELIERSEDHICGHPREKEGF